MGSNVATLIILLQYEDKPMPEWEEEVVRKRPNGCVCFPRQEELKKYAHKTTKDLLLKWGCTLRDGVMRVVSYDL